MSKQEQLAWLNRAGAREPRAAKVPHELVQHGLRRSDDYYWLRKRDDPEVVGYLERENDYTDAVLEPYDGLRRGLVAEMKARIPWNESSVPYRDGAYFYYYRYRKGEEYPVYYRKHGSLDAAEQLLLDVNAIAGDHDYYSVRNFSVSPDHRKAAFAVDTEGRRFFTLRFLDLDTGRLLPENIPDVTSDFEWANDSRTLFYVRQDRETLRHNQVLRHRPDAGPDSLVHEETDPTYWLGIEKSLSGRHLFLVSAATLTTEVHYLPADEPDRTPQLFLRRETGHEYYVTDGEDRFFLLSNGGDARNFRLLETPLHDTSRNAWTERIPHRDAVLIDSVDVFDGHLVLSTVSEGLSQIEIVGRSDWKTSNIEFDEPVYSVYPEDNYEYRSHVLRYTYESLTTPPSVFDLDLATGHRHLQKEEPVYGGFDRRNYRAERHWVTARDGASVPVSLVYRLPLEKNGSRPLLQYGYGAYGLSVEPEFDSDILSLLDRGFIYAIAHVRGGSELGRQWYEAGRQAQKQNTFSDFIDVTRYLIGAGYTSAEHCYASGGSAGGLLIGAVANQAPELYNGLATRVPFVDVVTTMLDESIPLTTGEFDEWGNPAERAAFDCMLAYSPYDNVRAQGYPNMLVTTGLHDSQVQYWEPAKWVARLREKRTDKNALLLWIDMQAGHSGKSGRYRALEDEALVYTFFLLLEGHGERDPAG